MATVSSILPSPILTPRLHLDLFSHSNPSHTACFLHIMNTPTAHATMGDFGIREPTQFYAMQKRSMLRDPRFPSGKAEQAAAYMIRERRFDAATGAEGEVGGEVLGAITFCSRRAVTGGKDGREKRFVVPPPDLGWAMREEVMGRGYATEAAKEVLKVVSTVGGFPEVIVFRREGNEASNRVAQKVGFVDGGSCPSLDRPGERVAIWVMPGMSGIDDLMKDGIGFMFREEMLGETEDGS